MIPDWNIAGVLPPIRPGEDGHGTDRSPYAVSLRRVVERFATSSQRIDILQGLLSYRSELHNAGISNGFQWLDGSFAEQTELLESRHPNDIDVVTFFCLPPGMDERTLAQNHADLFRPDQTKSRFRVDAYPCVLGQPTQSRHVKQIAYWYSMWSHRRNGVWKGFVQVDLALGEDGEAAKALDFIRQEGGRP
ncbi:MAG: hypothetical protein V1792_04085 [Pseudomonadota bacterium]